MIDLKLEERFKNKVITPDDFIAIIEIPKGSKNKYEYDHDTQMLKLDRILFTSTHYPHNYGFIPLTLADDGDPLDVLVVTSEPVVPLSTLRCRPIGVLKMIDGGKKDYKIIAVSLNDPFYSDYKEISELKPHISDEIKHFFKVYKSLEGKVTDIKKIEDAKEARNVIQECIDAYKEEKEKFM